MPAQEMLVMRRRIERASGIPGVLFDYPSIKGSLADNVYLLAEFIAELRRGSILQEGIQVDPIDKLHG